MPGAMRQSKADIQRLPRQQFEEVLALTFPDGRVSSMCTLYAALRTGVAELGAVFVSLVASCEGHRRQLATARIYPGFTGPAIIATGVCVDGWHAEARGNGKDLRFSVSLAARECCSGFGIFVPPTLLQRIGDTTDPEFNFPMLPYGQEAGYYRPLFGTSGNVQIERWDRVTRIVATADAGADATVQGFPNSQVWTIPAGTTQELLPKGAYAGPFGLSFIGTIAFAIEKVR